MTTALAMLAFPSAALLAFVVTGAMRRYAIAASIIDLPNDRSSHSVPTPRGGGVGVVVAFTAAILVQATTQAIPVRVVLALLGSGLPVALVGYVDDRHPLPARLRFAVHAAASTWALWCMGGIPPVPIFGFVIDLGAPGLVLATDRKSVV